MPYTLEQCQQIVKGIEKQGFTEIEITDGVQPNCVVMARHPEDGDLCFWHENIKDILMPVEKKENM